MALRCLLAFPLAPPSPYTPLISVRELDSADSMFHYIRSLLSPDAPAHSALRWVSFPIRVRDQKASHILDHFSRLNYALPLFSCLTCSRHTDPWLLFSQVSHIPFSGFCICSSLALNALADSSRQISSSPLRVFPVATFPGVFSWPCCSGVNIGTQDLPIQGPFLQGKLLKHLGIRLCVSCHSRCPGIPLVFVFHKLRTLIFLFFSHSFRHGILNGAWHIVGVVGCTNKPIDA